MVKRQGLFVQFSLCFICSKSTVVFIIVLFQVENLTRKVKLQEIELEQTSKQLKEAVTVAGEESSKCKAAKEVIKSLTAQVRCVLLKPFKCFIF